MFSNGFQPVPTIPNALRLLVLSHSTAISLLLIFRHISSQHSALPVWLLLENVLKTFKHFQTFSIIFQVFSRLFLNLLGRPKLPARTLQALHRQCMKQTPQVTFSSPNLGARPAAGQCHRANQASSFDRLLKNKINGFRQCLLVCRPYHADPTTQTPHC